MSERDSVDWLRQAVSGRDEPPYFDVDDEGQIVPLDSLIEPAGIEHDRETTKATGIDELPEELAAEAEFVGESFLEWVESGAEMDDKESDEEADKPDEPAE